MYNLQSHIIEHGGATPTWSYMREALSKRFRASCNNAIFHVAKSEICVDMQRGENVTRSNTEEHWWWTHITKKVIHAILKKKLAKMVPLSNVSCQPLEYLNSFTISSNATLKWHAQQRTSQDHLHCTWDGAKKNAFLASVEIKAPW